jgi:hypothetical protein
MKLFMLMAVLMLVVSVGCNSKKEAEVGHDKEHAHVEEADKVDHSHEDGHHEEHDHQAHHPEHDAE